MNIAIVSLAPLRVAWDVKFVRDGKKVADQIPLDGWVIGFERPAQRR